MGYVSPGQGLPRPVRAGLKPWAHLTDAGICTQKVPVFYSKETRCVQRCMNGCKIGEGGGCPLMLKSSACNHDSTALPNLQTQLSARQTALKTSCKFIQTFQVESINAPHRPQNKHPQLLLTPPLC